jgi:hypothetical protein
LDLTSVHLGVGAVGIGGIVLIPFIILGFTVLGVGAAVGAILTGDGMILFGTPDLIAGGIHGGGIRGVVAVTGRDIMPDTETEGGPEAVGVTLGTVAEGGIVERTDRVVPLILMPIISIGIIPVAEAGEAHGHRVTETFPAMTTV